MEIVEALNVLLANQFILNVKLRNYHWNVQGPHFNDLHTFFGVQYAMFELMLDETAERVRQKKAFPLSSMKEFLEHTTLSEAARGAKQEGEMLSSLISDYSKMAASMKAFSVDFADSDPISVDLISGHGLQVEKGQWMLESLNEANEMSDSVETEELTAQLESFMGSN